MENQPFDITLTLTNFDVNRSKTLLVHKNILSTNSLFFEKLFTGFKEKDQDKVTIQVPNIDVVYDIIAGLYGQKSDTIFPNWQYQLELVKCRDYLDMRLSTSLLTNIKVPAEAFDLLLDAIDLIGCEEETMEIINNNLPDNYDVSKFPKELIDGLIRVNRTYQIISLNVNYQVEIYDPLLGKIIRTLDENDASTSCVSYYYAWTRCICYSPDNKHFATGGTSKIKIWNAETGILVKTIVDQNCSHLFITYSPDSQRIATGGTNNIIKIRDVSTGYLIHHLVAQPSVITCAGYSPDNLKIISGDSNGRINIWDAQYGNLIKSIHPHTYTIKGLCYAPNNQTFASASNDGTIIIWDAFTFKIIRTLTSNFNQILNTSAVLSICYSPDSLRIISGNDANIIEIWDIITGNLIQTLEGHECEISSVCCSSDNQIIVSGSEDKTIKIWNAGTGNLIQTIHGYANNILNVAVAVAVDINNKFIKRLSKINIQDHD